MAELVDATDSKSVVRKDVQVRFLFWAQKNLKVKPEVFYCRFVALPNIKPTLYLSIFFKTLSFPSIFSSIFNPSISAINGYTLTFSKPPISYACLNAGPHA
jgi:hypothetical protein